MHRLVRVNVQLLHVPETDDRVGPRHQCRKWERIDKGSRGVVVADEADCAGDRGKRFLSLRAPADLLADLENAAGLNRLSRRR